MIVKNSKSEFSRNVTILLTGTALAQAIPLAVSPILTRFYSPEEFGLFAIYFSITSMISIIATGCYEWAIMLPRNEEDAVNITALSVIIAILVSLVTLVIIVLFNEPLSKLIGAPEIKNWLYLLPVSVLLAGVYQSLNIWSNRKKQYKIISVSRVVQTASTAGTNIGMGFNSYGVSGLILGGVIGQVCSVGLLSKAVINEDSHLFKKINRIKIKYSFFKYMDFLKFATPSALFNSLSNIGFPIVIGIFFNSTIVGMYFFSNKIIRAPLGFILKSISQVYYQTASELYVNDKHKLLTFTYQTQLKIILMLIPVLFIVSIISPYMFEIIFGDRWRVAGEYVKYFAILVFFNNLYSPISSLSDILNEQRFTLIFNISLSLSQICIIYISSCFFDFKITMLIVSIVSSIHYIYIDYYMKSKLKLSF